MFVFVCHAPQLRDYDWQCLHEEAEREGMFNEELDQTEFDRFWGLDLYQRIQNEEESRLRKVWHFLVRHRSCTFVWC